MNPNPLIQSTEGKTGWIQLPSRDCSTEESAFLSSSVDVISRRYCDIVGQTAYSLDETAWTEHWLPSYLLVSPELLLQIGREDRQPARVFCGNEIQSDYLRANGFPSTRAIGHPFCYADSPVVDRRAGSILLVPGSLFSHPSLTWSFADYLAEIVAIRDRFSEIVAYLHPRVIRQTDWVAQLAKAHIPFIVGLEESDGNSILRSRFIYQQFEFVTFNGLNAQLPCAAVCGARVSIFGTYASTKVEDLEDVSVFLKNPGLASRAVPLLTENIAREQFPSLFCSPFDSQQCIEWGRSELGWEFRQNPSQLLPLIFKSSPKPRVSKIRLKLAESVSKLSLLWPSHRSDDTLQGESNIGMGQETDLAPLSTTASNLPGSIEIQGKTFHYIDARTFLHEYTQIFIKKCYDFPSIYDSPRIIDGGANIGIACRYWLSKFPHAKVHAFEPDPRLFEVLKKNLAGYSSEQVELHNAALWKSRDSLRFCSTGYETGHLAGVQTEQTGEFFFVKTHLLSDLLDGPADFLKLDIEGAEEAVLHEAASKLDNVKRIWLEYHSFVYRPQQLGSILDVLQSKGFRYHIVTESAFAAPFKTLEATYGMDQRLNIWAVRGDCFPNMIERDMSYLNENPPGRASL